ncbi:vegetative cell wall protein gp1-like [Triticum urartu]|uniref:vegetative cell wall protein gp1-like n=1 Tax=Triticum urartu TaxID=4572 RepID=UPI0020440104|nr:vegetative cell wall protein gp1-like [Triticum urartu]
MGKSLNWRRGAAAGGLVDLRRWIEPAEDNRDTSPASGEKATMYLFLPCSFSPLASVPPVLTIFPSLYLFSLTGDNHGRCVRKQQLPSSSPASPVTSSASVPAPTTDPLASSLPDPSPRPGGRSPSSSIPTRRPSPRKPPPSPANPRSSSSVEIRASLPSRLAIDRIWRPEAGSAAQQPVPVLASAIGTSLAGALLRRRHGPLLVQARDEDDVQAAPSPWWASLSLRPSPTSVAASSPTGLGPILQVPMSPCR